MEAPSRLPSAVFPCPRRPSARPRSHRRTWVNSFAACSRLGLTRLRHGKQILVHVTLANTGDQREPGTFELRVGNSSEKLMDPASFSSRPVQPSEVRGG